MPSVPVEEMDPIVAVVVIASHLARLSTAYFPKPSNLKSEDGFTGEVMTSTISRLQELSSCTIHLLLDASLAKGFDC